MPAAGLAAHVALEAHDRDGEACRHTVAGGDLGDARRIEAISIGSEENAGGRAAGAGGRPAAGTAGVARPEA